MNKLCLGTVQFGLDYGVNNFSGKPTKKAVFEMLDIAINNGIEWFDTATAYGNAEALLGEYGIRSCDVKIISKLRPNLFDNDQQVSLSTIERQIRESLDRIGVNTLDGYLLHTPEYFYNEKIIDGLKHCKQLGMINNIGVSIYETQHALDVVKSGIVDYIQIPYSVFDQRVDHTDFFHFAKLNKVKVFARSAFLQGLIVMNEKNIPDHLVLAKEYLQEFDDIIASYGFNRVEAAFLFSYTHPQIDYVVFGVDNKQHLLEDIQIASQEKAEKFIPCRQELSKHFFNISKSIIFPSLWAKKR